MLEGEEQDRTNYYVWLGRKKDTEDMCLVAKIGTTGSGGINLCFIRLRIFSVY